MIPYDSDLQSYNAMVSDLELDKLWRAIRKLSKKKSQKVVYILTSRPGLNFGEIRNLTGLSVNDLNHALSEMREKNLIIKCNENYYVTAYCVSLIVSLNQFQESLKGERPFERYERDPADDVGYLFEQNHK